MKRLILLVLCLIGCGKYRTDKPTFTYKGVEVFIDSKSDAIVNYSNTQKELEKILDVSANYWGIKLEDISDYQIEFVDNPNLTCGYFPLWGPHVIGCTESLLFGKKHITVDIHDAKWIGDSCLPHEIGHAYHGDTFHTNPLFQDFEPVWKAIAVPLKPGFTKDDWLRSWDTLYDHPDEYLYWRSPPNDWWDYVPAGEKLRKL